jgi:hypothetical protein
MRMSARSRLALAASVAGLLWTASPALAAETISGEIVDLACYLPHPEMKGAGHRKCAETCIKKGLPMGLLGEDEQVYLLLENHDNPKPYAALKEKAAQRVTVEGEKVNRGGIQGFVVEVVQ